MKLEKNDEQSMVNYLEECWEFGIPQQKSDFAAQVAHYLECHNMINSFPNVNPGMIILVSVTHAELNAGCYRLANILLLLQCILSMCRLWLV